MYLRHHGKRSPAGPRRVDDDAVGILTERRRHRRRAGAWTAIVETTHGERIGSVVLDLSPGGAKLLLERPIAVGELVSFLTERFGTHRGRIAWVSGVRVGLAFANFAVGAASKALADKPEFLGKAKALLFPISWPEPFGLVMIESMACGTPVIAFDCGSVPEIMEDGLTGFVVRDIAGAVAAVGKLDLLFRPSIRSRFEERFSARAMALEYVRIYRELANTDEAVAVAAE